MPIKNQMIIQFPNRTENVGIVRVAIAAFAAQLDFSLSEIEEIKVAISEGVTNAVVHAYPEDTGMITVIARIVDAGLELVIQDEGKGIDDIARAKQPSFSTDPERMGLGFVFMESFMDKFDVKSQPGKGTTISMVKYPKEAESKANS